MNSYIVKALESKEESKDLKTSLQMCAGPGLFFLDLLLPIVRKNLAFDKNRMKNHSLWPVF